MTQVCSIVLECPNGTKHIYNRKTKQIVPLGIADLEQCQFASHRGANQAFARLWKESIWILFQAGWSFEYGNLYVYPENHK
jgi:hypothetical protein